MAHGRGIKKPVLVASDAFRRLFQPLSKASLIDALWCACQLGTNESAEEIATQAARNAVIAMELREDRIPPALVEQSKRRIDSDGDGT